MITAIYTHPRTHETFPVQVLASDRYLSVTRFIVRALRDETPFIEWSSEGYPVPTRSTKVFRESLSCIVKVDTAN